MDYLVIELDTEPHIITINEVNSSKTHIKGKSGNYNAGGEPVIFKDKNTAFRVSSECRHGLVYPIVDIMKTLEALKVKYGSIKYNAPINEILTILDEII